jgi:hypothetical protein
MTTVLEGVEGVNIMPPLLFTPEKDPVPIVQEAGWAPRPVWTGAENLTPYRDSIPQPSSPQPVATPTTLPGPLSTVVVNNSKIFRQVAYKNFLTSLTPLITTVCKLQKIIILYLHTHTPIMCITAKLTEPNFY